jgi:prolyl-tRNA editing enzyme YbaK/EbsC (Cys-tRNA(Pro) deacylase)
VSLEAVRAEFAHVGRDGDIREFEVSSATVAEAAVALGTQEERIAKTLAVCGPDGPDADEVALIVAAGDAKLAGGPFKRRFGYKPHMIPGDRVERLTGHAPGGVCPFANPAGVMIYLDESLRRFDVVYPACGSSNSAVGLTLAELEQLSGAAGWVDVCKGWQEAPAV